PWPGHIYSSLNLKPMGNLGFQEALLLAALCIVIVPFIFYLLTLQNTLKIISARNRGMKPDNVWVMLVPLCKCYIYIFYCRCRRHIA
ncbi:MAG TPA: hypothetical protein VHB48_21835, partial [Chitinophagaceae bacterium]|nr:hypothetical protein [Chitinophagaceae bacterium]